MISCISSRVKSIGDSKHEGIAYEGSSSSDKKSWSWFIWMCLRVSLELAFTFDDWNGFLKYLSLPLCTAIGPFSLVSSGSKGNFKSVSWALVWGFASSLDSDSSEIAIYDFSESTNNSVNMFVLL